MTNEERASLIERTAAIVRQTSLTNVLMLLLLIIVLVPTYFAYRFMTDASFRHEFLISATLIETTPCIVLKTSTPTGIRYSIGGRYGFYGHAERIIALRSQGDLTPAEIHEHCKEVFDEIKKYYAGKLSPDRGSELPFGPVPGGEPVTGTQSTPPPAKAQ